MEAYIGSVWAFGFNFTPFGWAYCNGSLIAISENEALFALLGTTYGGDGISTFALPNLQGRVPIGIGQGPGLSNYELGQMSGSETATLLTSNLPPHNHPVVSATLPVSSSTGETNDPTNAYFGLADGSIGNTYSNTSDALMAGPSIAASSVAGNNIPINILRPLLAVNYCICMEGIFPSRN